ncbi:helix-turn-helix domain-containing protein [Hymenobacter crusticola]|uniref:Helix-turn-helix domain-containing protein n=1 Tax=Hymenobacter crusticola TaxID=1770526 RepID=A0A243W6T4_9BACT|nr:helix-turn-helix domain-containing protein [Hymenobacter crusticola]OUJ68043.1 hypothetical protein BXP70_28135 [Hymenobacter crusticola]
MRKMEQLILSGMEITTFYANIRKIVRDELDGSRNENEQPSFSVPEKPLTLREASSLLGVSLATIHQLKRNQQLPFFKVGGRVYLKKRHVLALRDGEQIPTEL